MTANAHKHKPGRSDEGYVLVFVLIAVALIAVLATFMVRSGHEAAKQAQLVQQLSKARFGADGAVHALVADLLDGTQPVVSQGDLPASLLPEGYRGTFQIRPTSGLVDLNRAPDPLLSAVFKAAGAADPDALVAAVSDWRDRDRETTSGGAERDYYAARGQPGPSNRPFVAVRELLYVRRMDRRLYTRIADALTVWGTRRLDESLAHPLVARALVSLPRAERRSLLAAPGPAFSAPTEITVTLNAQGGASFTRQAVVRLLPGQPLPFLILDWGQGEGLPQPQTGPLRPSGK